MGMPTFTIERQLREHLRGAPRGIIAAYFWPRCPGNDGRSERCRRGCPLEAAPPATLEGLPLDLENAIHQLVARPVQVTVLNTAPVSLVHRVLRDGVLVLDQAPSARIRFEVRARNEFFDLQPILARYRRRALAAP